MERFAGDHRHILLSRYLEERQRTSNRQTDVLERTGRMNKSTECPFCGMAGEACYVNSLNGAKVYQCQWCGAQTNCQDEWESRPLEESLRDKNEILQSKLARERRLSDEFYLLLVDDPNTKLKADQIMVNIFGKCEPSRSEVSTTPDVLMDIKKAENNE